MVLAKLRIMVLVGLLLSSTLTAAYTITHQAHYHAMGLLTNKDDATELSNTKALGSEVMASRHKWVRSRKMGAVGAMGRLSKVKLAGLVPFSSDYHAPKTHPPKNN